MEFLKSLFEKGALTWEQFQQAAKDAGYEVVNAAGDAYVLKADLDTREQELTTANSTIKSLRDATTNLTLTRAALLMGDIEIGADGKVTSLGVQVESLKRK